MSIAGNLKGWYKLVVHWFSPVSPQRDAHLSSSLTILPHFILSVAKSKFIHYDPTNVSSNELVP